MTCGVDQSKVHGRGFIRGGYQGPTVQLQRPFLAASNWIELIEQFAHQLWRPEVGLLECVGFCGMHLALRVLKHLHPLPAVSMAAQRTPSHEHIDLVSYPTEFRPF